MRSLFGLSTSWKACSFAIAAALALDALFAPPLPAQDQSTRTAATLRRARQEEVPVPLGKPDAPAATPVETARPAFPSAIPECPVDGELEFDGDSIGAGEIPPFPVPSGPPPRATEPDLELTGTSARPRLVASSPHAFWHAVEYQALEFRCLPPDFANPVAIAFFLDGKPFGGVKLDATVAATIPCPPLGRHLMQARYLDADLGWSVISAPLRIEVLPPAAPTIEAIGDSAEPPAPYNANQPVHTTGALTLHVGHAQPDDRIDIYANDRHLAHEKLDGKCRIRIGLLPYLEPGVHQLRIRRSDAKCDCGVASLLSPPVEVHFFNPDCHVSLPQACSKNRSSTKTEEAAPAKDGDCTLNRASNRVGHFVSTNALLGPKPGDSSTPSHASPAAETPSSESSCSTFYFPTVAHFPARFHSLAGQTIAEEGVLIYEGMSFSIDKAGKYEVKFLASTPSRPATLRMQLLIQRADGFWLTLTLRPIDIPSAYEAHNDPRDLAGKSFKIEGVLPGWEGCCGAMSVRRDGTARFGYERAQTSTTWKQ